MPKPLGIWVLLACIGLWVERAPAASPDDARIFAQIDALLPIAAGIVVDGDCSDWGAIPVLPDPAGDAGGDAARDITGVAIAALEAAILFSHTIPGSIPFAALDPVPAGSQVGALGNSGVNFSFPHLHHEVRDLLPEPDVSIALALTEVDVGLNPDLETDPWRRSFEQWVPREGFFARRSPTAIPALPAGSLGPLVCALLGLVLWRRAQRGR